MADHEAVLVTLELELIARAYLQVIAHELGHGDLALAGNARTAAIGATGSNGHTLDIRRNPAGSQVTDPKRIVERGYDVIADRYLAWSGDRPSPTRQRALDLVIAELATHAEVLELGCGAGVPMTATLAARHRVHGIDISARQIVLATKNVPGASFQQADMASVDFAEDSYDAVVAFYALTHLPRNEQGPLLERIVRWLRPGGLFFATMGVRADPGTIEDDWLGAPMYFSHHDAATNRRLVEAAGLTVTRAEVEAEDEDGQPVEFLWLMARKPSGDGQQGGAGAS